MSDRTDKDALPRLEGNEVRELVLSILLERHPALIAFDELAAEFLGPNLAQSTPDSVIHDAIDELVRLGLAHRLDQFIFASYTAVQVKQLGV